jgi:hypothetical protein
VGLIQRTLETNGIATISITLSQEISRKVKPPRAVFTGYPLGHPLGFPGQRFRQLQLLRFLLQQTATLDTPGSIVVENMASDQDPTAECLMCRMIGAK